MKPWSILEVFAALAFLAPTLGCGTGGGPSDDPDAGGQICANDDGRCPAGCTAANDTDCGVDTTGTWYVKISASGTLKVSGLAKISQDVTVNAWIRNYISPTGDLTFSICKLTAPPGQSSGISTTFSQALIDTLQTTGKLTGGTRVMAGDTLNVPALTIYSGQTPTGSPVDAPPPTLPAGDGDGHPGVTITTKLDTATIDVYAGLVINTTLSGVKVTDATTMTGNTAITTHGVVFDSTNTVLAPRDSTIDLTTTAATIPFTAKKLDSDGSTACAAIANMQ